MDKPPTRLPLYVGLLLIACGWAAIYLGWRQAGEQELDTGQIPFLLSGGFGGLGLLLMGVGGVLVDAVQRASWMHRHTLEQVRSLLERVATSNEGLLERAEEAPGRRTTGRSPTRRRRTAGASDEA